VQDRILVDALLKEGQEHLFSGWPPAAERDDAKRRLLDQLHHLNKSYASGLVKYIKNARKLLHDSKEGEWRVWVRGMGSLLRNVAVSSTPAANGSPGFSFACLYERYQHCSCQPHCARGAPATPCFRNPQIPSPRNLGRRQPL
jgi:hypothetical protein